MCGEFCHVASFLSLPLKTEKILVVLGLSTQRAMCFSKPQGRPAEGPPRHWDGSSPTAKPDLDPREGAAGPMSQAHLASPAGGRNLAGGPGRAGLGAPVTIISLLWTRFSPPQKVQATAARQAPSSSSAGPAQGAERITAVHLHSGSGERGAASAPYPEAAAGAQRKPSALAVTTNLSISTPLPFGKKRPSQTLLKPGGVAPEDAELEWATCPDRGSLPLLLHSPWKALPCLSSSGLPKGILPRGTSPLQGCTTFSATFCL